MTYASLEEHNVHVWQQNLKKRLSQKANPSQVSKVSIMLLIDLPQDLFKSFVKTLPSSVSIGLPLQRFADLQSFFPQRNFWLWIHKNVSEKIEEKYEGIVYYPFVPKTKNFFLSTRKTKKIFIPDQCEIPIVPKSLNINWGDVILSCYDSEQSESEKIKYIDELCDKTGNACITILVQKKSQIPKIQSWIKKWSGQ